MPGLIGIGEYIDETREDFNSPTTSTFVSKMPQCRQTVATLEETLDFDRDGLTKMKKAVKAIFNSGNSHVDNEMYMSKALEKLGGSALSKDQEPDVGAAFLKFCVVTKELSALMKTLMQNMNNIVLFPVDNVLKGELRGVKGDLKRPFDKAWKDYETKFSKIEKEKKQQAKEAGLIRTEVTPAEVADEMDKERKMFQLQMCEYLIKVNEIKTKKGVELLQHLVEYYHAQTNYFQDGLKTIEHFGTYIQDLSAKLQKIRLKQDDEKKKLTELRNMVKSSPGFLDKEGSLAGNPASGYSLHQLQGDKQHGYARVGHLLKKSEGKMRKVWQKRKCEVRDGFLDVFHADEAKPPTRVNLLTCQIKAVTEDKRCFDLVSYNRTYHFQAEDEQEQIAWMSVLVNCKEGALMKAFDDSGKCESNANQSVRELQQAVVKYIMGFQGNDRCCDCNSQNDSTWLSTNFGIIVCIECSGVHRDLGVHISRIQSLKLDNIGTSQLLVARAMTNETFNEVMEATLHGNKPTPTSTMEERYEFIRAKYVDKRFALRTCGDQRDLLNDLEHAITTRDIQHLLQAFVEGADLAASLPSSDLDETGLHLAISQETNYSLHIVDFLVQNSSSIDRQTKEGNTPLHYCVMLDKTECMKLLLRSGADPVLENNNRKTPLDIARERGNSVCEELLTHALQRKKTLFENVNVDWNLTPEDRSTDFSDDETVVEDRNGALTPEKVRQRSRPPSYAGGGGTVAGGDSPLSQRSRSSTCDSLKSSISPGSNFVPNHLRGSQAPIPPPQNRKPSLMGLNPHNSLKKRVAPQPPPTYATLPSSTSHSRTSSDPPHSMTGTTFHHHKRSPSSSDSGATTPPGDVSTRLHSSLQAMGGRLVLPPGEPPLLKNVTQSDTTSIKSTLSQQQAPLTTSTTSSRPRIPPPPTPLNRLSNGRSTESISSMSSDVESVGSTAGNSNPVPPPRKPYFYCPFQKSDSTKRCRALYDCEADNEDELSFREGEVILVTNEHTEDENWMEGMVETDLSRRGMFPISFVHMLTGNSATSPGD